MIFPTINHFSVVLVKWSREMLQDLHSLRQFRYCVGLLANFTHQCVEILLQDFNGSVQCLQSGAVKKKCGFIKTIVLIKTIEWNVHICSKHEIQTFFVHWTNFNMCNPTALIEREKLPRLTWRLVWMDPVSAEPVVPWESFIYKNIYNTDKRGETRNTF